VNPADVAAWRGPTMPTAEQNLVLALGALAASQLPKAEQLCREALHAVPDHAQAWRLLGNVQQAAGRFAEAAESYRRCLRLRPDQPALHNSLGIVLARTGAREEAAAAFREAIRLRPDHVRACHNLGNVLKEMGRLDEAIASYREAVRLEPGDGRLHYHLARALQNRGLLGPAEASLREAVRLAPAEPEGHYRLGIVLAGQGKLEEAVESCRAAIHLRPDHAEAHMGLGNALRDLARLDEALGPLNEALRLRPTALLRATLATLLPAVYTSAEDVRRWRDRLAGEVRRLREEGHSVDLTRQAATPNFYLCYQGENDRDLQGDVAGLYQAPQPALAPRAAGDRIRVGFLSRYFKFHTIGELMRGIIAGLSRDAFSVTVLSLEEHHDAVADYIRSYADEHVLLGTDLAAARDRVAGLGLDVLVYTDVGMDPVGYSLAFSRLAPVQCVTWGHPVTTGVPTLDYFLSSELFELPGAQAHYTETLVRLKGLPAYCYRPVLRGRARGREHFGLPADRHLYGCPQPVVKFHPDFDPLLADILRRDPLGLVVINHTDRAHYRHWQELLRRRFATVMPDVADRIRFLPRLGHDDYLWLTTCYDAMLDPPHFNGGNTSLKALALGVPVVTRPSAFLRGRQTLGFYRKMGVQECVADSPAGYAEVAVRLATDAAYREDVRNRIRTAAVALFEDAGPTRELEEFFRQAVARASGSGA
jgi:predicted O-linked N-acetylglucosamine transferase (SPINDLY family)